MEENKKSFSFLMHITRLNFIFLNVDKTSLGFGFSGFVMGFLGFFFVFCAVLFGFLFYFPLVLRFLGGLRRRRKDTITLVY